jgi:peptidoglycan/LPS O-acetylase OafA/YrhL
MDVDHLPELASGFVTLLLLPTLGVLGLMQRRAIPVLAWTLVAWALGGAAALYWHYTFTWSENRFLHGWVMGLGLGTAFLAVAMLRNNPKVAPWLKLVLALVTIAVFARSLLEFLERYA